MSAIICMGNRTHWRTEPHGNINSCQFDDDADDAPLRSTLCKRGKSIRSNATTTTTRLLLVSCQQCQLSTVDSTIRQHDITSTTMPPLNEEIPLSSVVFGAVALGTLSALRCSLLYFLLCAALWLMIEISCSIWVAVVSSLGAMKSQKYVVLITVNYSLLSSNC